MTRLIKKAKYITKNNRAFTLAEVLVAIIIMLLVSAIVAAGIPAAARAYDNIVIASNAEVLLSTSMSALRNELSTARDVKVDNNEVVFYNEAYGSMSRIYLGSDGSIMFDKYYNATAAEGDLIGAAPPGEGEYEAKPLVSRKASGDKIYVTYETITPPSGDNGIIAFNNLKVVRTSDSSKKGITERTKYSIKVLTAKDSRMP